MRLGHWGSDWYDVENDRKQPWKHIFNSTTHTVGSIGSQWKCLISMKGQEESDRLTTKHKALYIHYRWPWNSCGICGTYSHTREISIYIHDRMHPFFSTHYAIVLESHWKKKTQLLKKQKEFLYHHSLIWLPAFLVWSSAILGLRKTLEEIFIYLDNIKWLECWAIDYRSNRSLTGTSEC